MPDEIPAVYLDVTEHWNWQASKPVGEDLSAGVEDGGKLAAAVGFRVKQALAPGASEPLLCSGCRTAGMSRPSPISPYLSDTDVLPTAGNELALLNHD